MQNIHFKTKDMRIKFNDKIYRLKEIESGVDSLMELVEEPRYKDGDFLHSDWENENITIIYRKIRGNNLYYHAGKSNSAGLSFKKGSFWSDDGDFRLATESEKKELIDALTGVGKRWNADKKCIEDIPKRKFKAGDKVKIKDSISSDTHRYVSPDFTEYMDKFIGKVLTVEEYSNIEWVVFYEDDYKYNFAEDWLELCDDKSDCIFKKGDRVIFSKDFSERMRNENGHFANNVKKYIGKPLTVSKVCNNVCVWIEGEKLHGFSKDCLELWIDEPKKGDLAIFWDNGTSYAIIRIYDRKDYNRYYDILGNAWKNAIKFESKEQFEKLIKGKIW